ncbi:MAG: glycoside hydrolase family 3 C-terminal domain-containing protein [Micromonosporaceae bacterium]|nr:glycoside hydrolase family 3 C-terminal domain-containing protein [Micromonosporaceae bacterium]
MSTSALPPAARHPSPPYRDPALPVLERVEDLLRRMTLEEKVGLLFHPIVGMAPDGRPLDELEGRPGAPRLIRDRHISHMNLLGDGSPAAIAALNNHVQEIAAGTRLGIPVTLSTDPRHACDDRPGAPGSAGSFSRWPEPAGLAAVRDEDLVRQFADIVRQEYLAVGLRVALHPQADLATEPRWARVAGTFGEDAGLAGRMVAAAIEGLRHSPDLGPDSVAAMVKHFPGGGPQKDGEDPHFPHGREQVYPGGRFAYHLAPFQVALAAGVTQVMSCYGMPVGTPLREVGFAFNREVITGLLREDLGFDGIVCTDWGLVTDSMIMGEPHQARAWGVEHLDHADRVFLLLEAGVDQFGGEYCTELVVDLVRSGRVAEERIDASVRRLLAEKVRLGLFERPFVDPEAAAAIVGRADFVAAGRRAQERSITVLSNSAALKGGEVRATPGTLPITRPVRAYVEGIDRDTAAAHPGILEVVSDPAAADLAILRLTSPHEQRATRFEGLFPSGRLDFPAERLEQIMAVLEAVPTVVAIGLTRPAVIPELATRSAALLATYGADDVAVLDVIFGRAVPEGRLPFQLPRTMAAVEASLPDVPQDGDDPLFPLGHGLSMPGPGTLSRAQLPGPAGLPGPDPKRRSS